MSDQGGEITDSGDDLGGDDTSGAHASRWSAPRRWWRRASWRSRLVAVGITVLVLALFGTIGSLQGEVDDLEAANAELEGDLEGERDARSGAEDAATEADERADQAEADAADEIASMQDDFDTRLERLDDRQARLDRRERQIEEDAAVLAELTAAVEAASFSDGLYQIGTDIQPGLYRTNGGVGCYWAKLNSSNTSDYIDNHFGSGPQTVEISGGWFESSGCGTWRRG